MTVTVRFFAFLRDVTGAEACRLSIVRGASGLTVRQQLIERYPGLDGLTSCCHLAVNCEYRPWAAPVADGDELALIPPVSGG